MPDLCINRQSSISLKRSLCHVQLHQTETETRRWTRTSQQQCIVGEHVEAEDAGAGRNPQGDHGGQRRRREVGAHLAVHVRRGR